MLRAQRMSALLDTVFERARTIRPPWRARPASTSAEASAAGLLAMARDLLGERSQSSGVGIARRILADYATLAPDEKHAFFTGLAHDFAPAPAEIAAAWSIYQARPGPLTLAGVTKAAEPPRQEVLRRLNQAPSATADLVRLRADLLDLLPDHPDLAPLEADLVHLLRSWFNRGFLVLRRIDWASPADFLERIIRYEAVHSIGTWAELRDRLLPQDRRCYAFVHPAMPDEPLIFVEVALCAQIPGSIQTLLAPDRDELPADQARVAVFYSISNCQAGLAGISFGQFLIKQVVEDLSREFPGLNSFVTLSPVPGFRRWLAAEHEDGDLPKDLPADHPQAKERMALAARYFLQARDRKGRPLDPVARFHLGNGARVERLCWMGDTSAKGMAQSGGLMVNYLYDLATLEANHEAFSREGTVIANPALHKLLREPAPA
ncbi:malonyl-CoA decarboxylase domain-containing protein [Novosphingobium terrae]|uniref:malonyl-CoA decarboxylase domain-containing protein n=1 Tax=Novosphingobium terrae TaxID=2726189 RepID=UPI001F1444A5|nr:malonyl-CoA decarboxylase family protein [Novosphingobium terrae]